ncbi:MAG: hypothetical protein ACM3VX_09155 [Bacteroidota bacterium]
MTKVTALAGRRTGNPGRRPPHQPAGAVRPAQTQRLDLAGMLWQQLTQTNRALADVYREVA